MTRLLSPSPVAEEKEMAYSDIQNHDDEPSLQTERELEGLPFIAPCRQLPLNAPIQWLQLGWQDFLRAPGVSLTYGGFVMLLSYALAFFTWQLGGYVLILSLMSGFVFIAPVLAIGLYSISCQLQRGLRPKIGYCLREGRRHLGSEMVYSVILLIIFLLWARAGSMVHVFFPMESQPHLTDLAVFLTVGTLVGALFATLVFTASAFSLPMMLDRRVDTVTAVLTSVHAVMNNKLPLLLWALFIVLAMVICVMTALLGILVLIPVIGYATWHAYRATIDPSLWPEHRPL
ncbi:MAG: DUF2189 domain-containing protein, partial [Gammaproteobacteria bacterium]|nr:DUF2189 domain-containing protein [Gammaproteobacteria bacterium]